ncbi:MAG: glycosyltransferase family 39 protein [Pseudomonadales bacterium]|jgi:4-amino-4-deoxy-L-arabinose transferase-like glycosyltransferase|nr:glycosyltransferase family 39 protein [Pseudomonadales bacterium]
MISRQQKRNDNENSPLFLTKKILSKIKKYHHIFIPIFIFALAFLLRLWNLGSLPYSLHDDEVWNAYIGRFILENGEDLNGKSWPILYSDKFGDYPPVLPMYLSGISTYIFGVNAFAVRLPIAILGGLSVVLIYFLAKWIFSKPSIAYLAALFMAVMPWHIILSRATAEGIVGTFIFILGLFLLFKAIDKQKISLIFVPAYLFIFASYLFYPSFRIIAPMVLLPTFLLSSNPKLKKLLIGMTVLAFALTIGISQTDWGSGRFDQLSIMTHNDVIPGRALNYSLALGPNRVLQARIFNNRYVLASREFARQYTSHFSPQFLTGGDYIQPKRYELIEHGTAYWILLIVIVGLIIVHIWKPFSSKQFLSTFQTGRARFFLILIWLLLITPIPSSLTLEEVPNIHRTVMMTFGWATIFALATHLLINAQLFKYWKAITTAIIAIIFAIEVAYFVHAYTSLDYVSNFTHRDDKYELLANWLIDNGSDYDLILIPDQTNLLLQYLFFKQDFSPEHFSELESSYHMDSIGNIHLAFFTCDEAANQKLLNPEKRIAVITTTELCLTDRDDIVQFIDVDEVNRRGLTRAFNIQAPELADNVELLETN